MFKHCTRGGVVALAIALASSAGVAQLTTVRVASGLTSPTFVTAPDGDADRLFVTERAGRIRIVVDGAILPTDFLDLTSKVIVTGGGGLLGMAFDPDYATNGFFYVKYTGQTGIGDTWVERYSVDPGDPDVALPASAFPLLTVVQPDGAHNGGTLAFGADGMLYIGMGDGGDAFDMGPGHAPEGNGQSPSTLLGKMLRLDPDLPAPHVPADNPFVGDPTVLDEIWAFGLRNPFRFSFDDLTGDMYIADVGQAAFEEVNVEPPGAGGRNYGWRCMEGTACTGLTGCTCNAPVLTDPIHQYVNGTDCSITGGEVYRGSAIPSLQGAYFFADVCSNRIWSFEWNGVTTMNLTERTTELAPADGSVIEAIVAIAPDGVGELHFVNLITGEIWKLIECPAPVTYCTPKTTTGGCVAVLGTNGMPFLDGSTFEMTAAQVPNFVNGLFFYSWVGGFSSPFLGGTLCVKPPLRRTNPMGSFGNFPPPFDCSGTYTFDMSAELIANPFVQAGSTIHGQWWFRDPPDAFGTGLSGGITFDICGP